MVALTEIWSSLFVITSTKPYGNKNNIAAKKYVWTYSMYQLCFYYEKVMLEKVTIKFVRLTSKSPLRINAESINAK